jgi:hypothetical protein
MPSPDDARHAHRLVAHERTGVGEERDDFIGSQAPFAHLVQRDQRPAPHGGVDVR